MTSRSSGMSPSSPKAGGERWTVLATDARERYGIAVHEAAHAVAALLLDGPVDEVKIVGRGGHCAIRLAGEWDALAAINEAIIALVGERAAERARVPAAIEVPVVVQAQEVVEVEAAELW